MSPERLLRTHSLYSAEGGLWRHPQCHFRCAIAGSMSGKKDKAAILFFPRGIKPLPYTRLFLNILQVKLALEFKRHTYTKVWTNAENKHILPVSSISVAGPSPSCGTSQNLRRPLDTTLFCSPLFTNHCQELSQAPSHFLFLHWPLPQAASTPSLGPCGDP